LNRRAFVLLLAVSAFADTWTGVERIVAVGDVHGSFDQFATVLRQAGVIDDKNRWSGGRTHLVQLGDVPDRGPHTRRIMDLLMDLEKQARKAGGMVHALIGNHEAMNVYGDLRYTVPEEFAAFRNGGSEEIRSRLWEQHVDELKRKGSPEHADGTYRKQWDLRHPAGFLEHRHEFQPGGRYGRWICSHNAIIKINDTLFLHGGLSPKYAATPLSEMNKRVRKELSDFKLLEGGMVLDPEGPLWYRGLASGSEGDLESHVDALLKFHGAKRIVLGHTPVAGIPVSRFGGKVILADVGLGIAYGGRIACLVIERDQPVAMKEGRLQPVPALELLPPTTEIAAH
jgi:hypothetical protein